MVVELRPHQEKAIEKLSNGKILYGDVGVGKSLTALAYYYTRVCQGAIGDYGSMRSPRDLYIITTAKKRDQFEWRHEIHMLDMGPERDHNPEGVEVTIDSWNNIHKYKEVKDAFFIFDEQRLVGAGAWVNSFLEIAKHNQWIILSATPGDTWLDYIPVFVANGWYKNRTEFKQKHVRYVPYVKYPKVDHYLGVGRLVRLRNQLLVEMPMPRSTIRHEHVLFMEHDEELLKKVVKDRWHVYENRPIKNVSELFSVMKKVVNSDDSRVAAISELMTTHPKLIVFYNFDYELEMLRSLATPNAPSIASGPTTAPAKNDQTFSTAEWNGRPKGSTQTGSNPKTGGSIIAQNTTDSSSVSEASTKSVLTVAEWNGHKHEPIPETDRWVYLVQYTAGSEGWNCIDTDAICFYSLTYSYKSFFQAKGRIDRMNTKFTDLHYYVLRSRAAIDYAIWKALRGKKDFNESSFEPIP